MARKRGFDEDEVLDKAMRLFWQKGYVATSMSDIYAETGLKPGSLYAAFTDKEQLFRRAFERYADIFRSTLPAEAQGKAAISAWLRLQAALAADDPERKGCLIINTVMERSAHAPETQALADERLAEIRDFFSRHLAIAATRGEIAPEDATPIRADALLGAVVAIMALGRAGVAPATIAHVAEDALRAVPVKSIMTD